MSAIEVTILCADVSINCLSRALTLAEIIADNHRVRIIGFARRENKIWSPASATQIPIQVLEYGYTRGWLSARKVVSSAAAGSRLIICKPRLTSLGLARLAGCNPGSVILDINDWELGLALESDRADGNYNLPDLFKNLHSPNSPALALFFEKHISRYPNRIVNNTWLQDRFGGQLIYDVRDTLRLDPAQHNKVAIRGNLDLDERIWVIFAGTPRYHKGLDILVQALANLDGSMAPGLLLCGNNPGNQWFESIVDESRHRLGKARFRHIQSFNRTEVSTYLAAADIACIPARLMSSTVGQVPTKLFEAMAMGLPVITTQICDMPRLTRGSGLSVPPGDVMALTEAIRTLAAHPDKLHEMAIQARSQAIKLYSYNAARPLLEKLLEPAVHH